VIFSLERLRREVKRSRTLTLTKPLALNDLERALLRVSAAAATLKPEGASLPPAGVLPLKSEVSEPSPPA